MKKLAIVTTHPVQYHVPWLVRLAERQIQVKVFYTWEQSGQGAVYDSGFGKKIQWDIPLLTGYDYDFVPNTSPRPGVERFLGLINPTLIPQIEAWEPDSILVIGWSYYSHLKCLLHFKGKIPVFFRGDSVLLHERWGLRKLARRIFLTWVYSHVDYALYVGSHNRAYYIKHGMQPEQLIFSPQAMDIARFSEPDIKYTNQAKAWKEELGIPPEHLTVLFAGKMTDVKNPYFILDLANACKELPISFIMVGDGRLREDLERRAEGKGNVRFLGFQNQSMMPAVYRMGDVFIMPSVSETWGMAINEAMACGRPVMASNRVGCAADLVLENKTGITFRTGDTGKCVQFLQRLCEDRSLVAEMGMTSTAVIQFFSFSHVVDSVALALRQPEIIPRKHWMPHAAM